LTGLATVLLVIGFAAPGQARMPFNAGSRYARRRPLRPFRNSHPHLYKIVKIVKTIKTDKMWVVFGTDH
jgi:hypothetical protein